MTILGGASLPSFSITVVISLEVASSMLMFSFADVWYHPVKPFSDTNSSYNELEKNSNF